jgi:hypothetical protein
MSILSHIFFISIIIATGYLTYITLFKNHALRQYNVVKEKLPIFVKFPKNPRFHIIAYKISITFSFICGIVIYLLLLLSGNTNL